jgi:transposase-like protein
MSPGGNVGVTAGQVSRSPKTPTVGVRAGRPDELWHIDTTVIRLLDGTRAYLHAVIDNYSRRILAWRVADRSTAANSVAVLLSASGQATSLEGTPDVLVDGGVENVNAQVDALVQPGIVRRLLALIECAYSNWLIEAWWRSLKHQWLFLNALDSVATVRRLVAFYVDEHNRVISHAALRGRTPDEVLRCRRPRGGRVAVAHGRRAGGAPQGESCGVLLGVSCARGRRLRTGQVRTGSTSRTMGQAGVARTRSKRYSMSLESAGMISLRAAFCSAAARASADRWAKCASKTAPSTICPFSLWAHPFWIFARTSAGRVSSSMAPA